MIYCRMRCLAQRMYAWLGLVILSAAWGHAATYYVSATAGDDSRTAAQAQDSATPWRTIQKAASTMVAGDRCVIRGGTYRETVTPTVNSLTFEAAAGEVPVVTGCDVITGWTLHAGATYRATVDTRVRAVFANGAHMQIARQPNEDGDPFTKTEWANTNAQNISTSGTGTATITFAGANWAPDQWVGGRYWGLHGQNFYQGNQGRITASTADTLTITDLNGCLRDGLDEFEGAGQGYIINHLAALDAATEWYWGGTTLYYQPTGGVSPATQTVEAQVRLWGFDLSGRSSVTVSGVRFFASSVLIDNGHSNTIDTCAFLYHAPWGDHREPFTNQGERGHYEYGAKEDGTGGIFVRGTGNVIKNSYIAHAYGLGVHIREGSGNTVENCLIEDFNWLAKQDGGGVFLNGPDHAVRRCTIRKTSAMAISCTQIGSNLVRRPQIFRNDLSDTGRLLLDGGQAAVYINNHNASSADRTLDGGRLAYNRVGLVNIAFNNGKGFGLYMDDGTHEVTIDHNVIFAGTGVRWPIFSNGSGHQVINFNVYNNTIWEHPDVSNGAGFVSSLTLATGTPANRVSINVRNNHAQRAVYREINGTAGDAVLSNNRSNVPATEFVDVAARDFRLVAGSASIDAGVAIPGITDGFAGTAPDIGAFEAGVAPWTAGSTLTGDPTGGPTVAVPSAPTNLTAAPEGTSAIRLNWTDNVSDEVGFRLERHAGDGSFQLVATPAANATTYLDVALAAGTYTYRLRAYNAAWDSANTSSASATILGGPLYTTTEFTPTADTWVRSDQPAANYGSTTAFVVQTSGSRTLESLLRFTPSWATGKVVVAASLRLREGPGGSINSNNSRISFRTPTAAWAEGTVTWATKPAYSTTEAAFIAANSISESQVVNTALPYAAFATSGAAVEWALVGTTAGTDVNFNSREAAADQPTLNLTLQTRVNVVGKIFCGARRAVRRRSLSPQRRMGGPPRALRRQARMCWRARRRLTRIRI
jgi:hypothetical protein